MADEVYRNDPNLVSLWLLEETGGDRADYTGNNELDDINTVGSSTDSQQGSRSADFERSRSEYLQISDANQTGLDFTGDFTLLAWIKPESVGSSRAVMGKYSTSGNQRSYILWHSSDNIMRLNVSSNGTSFNAAVGATALSAGTWYFVAGTYDGANLRVFLDGSVDSSGNNPKAYSAGINDGTANFRLGRHGDGSWQYDGLMDMAAVFDRNLTIAEVAWVYNNGIPEPPDGGIALPNNHPKIYPLLRR